MVFSNTGICTCFDNYLGADCSFDSDSPPVIGRVPEDGSGLCDKNEEDCSEISLYGKYFVDSGKAMCKIKREKVIILTIKN